MIDLTQHIRILVDGVPVEGLVVTIEGSELSLDFLGSSCLMKSKHPDSVFTRIIKHAPYAIDITTPNEKLDSMAGAFFDPPRGPQQEPPASSVESERRRLVGRSVHWTEEALKTNGLAHIKHHLEACVVRRIEDNGEVYFSDGGWTRHSTDLDRDFP